MKKMHRFALILASVLLVSGLFIPSALSAKTYIVNSYASDADANPGDGICATSGGQCSLYAAIQEANADGIYSTITFAQKFQTPNTIYGCGLPTITDEGTSIDASSQWDTTYDRPGVEIFGSGCTMLNLSANNSKILGLLLGGSNNVGVKISGSLDIIGGYNSGQRNVFIAGVAGVNIVGGTSNGIANNYFGSIDGSTSIGSGTNGIGILVQGGDYTRISDNLIVGQSADGIELVTSNNTVMDNIIGMSASQSTALPNQVGILVGGNANTIGSGNVIDGNTSDGIYIYHADSNNITGNSIGYSTAAVGNGGDGIRLLDSNNNHITAGNVIANNAGNGIYADASSSIIIQGSTIDSNDQVGIYFNTCSNNQIGGSGSNQLNSIGGNHSHGIRLETTSTTTVSNNYIGLRNGALDWGNLGYGIQVDNGSTDNTIGGSGLGEANWIGFNHLDGIELDGSSTQNNYVMGNMIGMPINWAWEAPNYNHGIGVYNGAHNNWIGWDGSPNGGNTILASGWSGVAVVGSNNNAVLDNHIGTNGMGVNWGNAFYGVTIGGSGNTVKGNEIAYNGTNGGLDSAQAGVLVDGVASINNMVSDNSIHDNDGPGIRLDNSANHNLAAPVITSANCNQVQGTACANCSIEFYSDYDGQGRVYEGHFTTPPSGAITWNGMLHGPNVTALAIGPGSSTDTSPFSTPFLVGMCTPPSRIYLPMVMK